MDCKEVVTLQIGKYASHAAAHFWNIQDEVAGVFWQEGNNDSPAGLPSSSSRWDSVPDARVLYHESSAATFKPRLLALDFKGGFGSVELQLGAREKLAMSDEDFRSQDIVSAWNGQIDIQRSEVAARTKYLALLDREADEQAHNGIHDETWNKYDDTNNNNSSYNNSTSNLGEQPEDENDKVDDNELNESVAELDGNVKYWTDYLKVELHSSNIMEFPAQVDASIDIDAGGFGTGHEIMNALGSAGRDIYEDISERVRKLVEECDLMQGFHLFADDWGGYAGMASTILSDIVTEYNPRPIFLFGSRPTEHRLRSLRGTPMNALNEGLAIAKLYGETSLTLPLHVPNESLETSYYSFDANQQYHVGALAAAIVDTATLPYRVHSGASCIKRSGLGSMDDYNQLMKATGGPILSASCSFPAEPLPPEDETDDMGITRLTDLRIAETSHDHLTNSLLTDVSGSTWAFNPVKHKMPKIKAEISILRGARTSSGAAASQQYAADSLQHYTMQRPLCVRRLSALDLPLYLPTSFPRVLKDIVGNSGEIFDPLSMTRRQGDVESCSMMVHLTALPSFSDKIKNASSMFLKASKGFQGRAIMQSWGMAQEDIDETVEKLGEMAVAYDEANAEEFSSDCDDCDSD